MSKMADLHAAGVTDLKSYAIGRKDERDELVLLLEKEKKAAESMGDNLMVETVTHLIKLITWFPEEANS